MSEIDARPAPTRGRSSYRGRGGFSRGGPRGGRKPVNGTTTETAQVEESFEDEGELGEMKKKYAPELGMLKDMFPDWTDVDLVFALQEADGDVPSTVDHITQGNVSQFAEVKSTKDRARSKVKEASNTAGTTDKPAMRSARGRGGFDSTRGGRGRAVDRGRGGFRGARGGHATTNGAPKDASTASVPTTESAAWDDSAPATTVQGSWDNPAEDAAKDSADAGQSGWGNAVASETTPAAASEGPKSSLIPEGGPKKTWASMLAPKVVPAPAKQAATAQAQPAEPVNPVPVSLAPDNVEEQAQELEALPSPPLVQEAPVDLEVPSAEMLIPEHPPASAEGDELSITPSKVLLTEENVEHLPDESHPPSTQTAASTTGSIDPRNLTPLPGHPAAITRPPLGGYATSAYRATGGPGRSASYQRRVQEQQEAVVMPGHNAVDRAAVQFGSMGLNGEPGPDVDDDREEPETRQAPQHSPPQQPRASLPPAPKQTMAPQEQMPSENMHTPRQAPGLPPASQQNQQQMQEAALATGIPSESSQMSQNYGQYGGYGQPSMQQDSGAQQHKPYDPFSHQAQRNQYDQFASHSQQAPQQHQQSQSGFGGMSSAPNDFSSYYTADQQRPAYNNFYGSSYGPQDARSQPGHGQQDGGLGQQRSASGFGAGPNDSAFSSQAQQQIPWRYTDATGSGHNTPNPLMGGPQQGGHTAQQQHSAHQASGQQQQQQQQQQAAYATNPAGYPYGHPYYSSPYQQAYQNQFTGYGSQQPTGYGGGYANKQQSMYGASQGYGMAPQSSYDQHAASPANAGAFAQNQQASMRSASGMSAGLGNVDEYGRSSAQPTAQQQQSSAFGGMNDAFARSTSGFGGQSGYGQQSMPGQEDSLKPFADSKTGPSPSLGQPGIRPGSAANSAAGTAHTGLPPSQSQQSGFGGYPGFPSQGQTQGQSQYGGLGGLGASQQHGQSNMSGQGGYASYGAGGFGQAYSGYSRGGGWGSQYGAH